MAKKWRSETEDKLPRPVGEKLSIARRGWDNTLNLGIGTKGEPKRLLRRGAEGNNRLWRRTCTRSGECGEVDEG